MQVVEGYDSFIKDIDNARCFNPIWKDVVKSFLNAYRAIEKRDLETFKSSVNKSPFSHYLLFVSPEFIGAKENKDLNSEHPVIGSVYLDFPSANTLEDLGSISFAIALESENLTKESKDWNFFKSVANYLVEIMFPIFEETSKDLTLLSVVQLRDFYANLYCLWAIYVRFLETEDLVAFNANRENFSVVIDNAISLLSSKDKMFNSHIKNFCKDVMIFFDIIDLDVFKSFYNEIELSNLDSCFSKIIVIRENEILARNALYMVENYPPRLLDDLNIDLWASLYSRFFNSSYFWRKYEFATFEKWQLFIEDNKNAQDSQTKFILALNSLFIRKYHILRNDTLPQSFLISLYWFNFYKKLNTVANLKKDNENKSVNITLKSMEKKAPIIKEDLERFKKNFTDDVALKWLFFLELEDK